MNAITGPVMMMLWMMQMTRVLYKKRLMSVRAVVVDVVALLIAHLIALLVALVTLEV